MKRRLFGIKKIRKKDVLKYSITGVLLVTMFIAGYVRVYVNTYNIMYEDKIVMFDVQRTEEGTSVTVLGHVFRLR